MTIEALRQLGHDLLDEYIALVPNQKHKRDNVYAEMEKRMKGRNPHFGQMRTKDEAMLAIGTLKKMIFIKKRELNIK